MFCFCIAFYTFVSFLYFFIICWGLGLRIFSFSAFASQIKHFVYFVQFYLKKIGTQPGDNCSLSPIFPWDASNFTCFQIVLPRRYSRFSFATFPQYSSVSHFVPACSLMLSVCSSLFYLQFDKRSIVLLVPVHMPLTWAGDLLTAWPDWFF